MNNYEPRIVQAKPPHYTTAQSDVSGADSRLAKFRNVGVWSILAVAVVFAITGAYFWGVSNASVTEVEILIPTPPPIIVQVSGEVNAPGVYELDAGARVFEAIDAAGGTTEYADTEGINLASTVRDGSSIVLPSVVRQTPATMSDSQSVGIGDAGQPKGSTEIQAANDGSADVIDLNTASLEELKSLPGIGDSRAAQIIAHRETIGQFSSIEQLSEINGIGRATIEAISALVVVR